MGRQRQFEHGQYRMFLALPRDFVAKFKNPSRLRKRMYDIIREKWPELPWDAEKISFAGTGFVRKRRKHQPSEPESADDQPVDRIPDTPEDAPQIAPETF